MYPFLLGIHSLIRWFVLVSLLIAIYKGFAGWFGNKPFLKIDNTIRNTTTTIAHIQLLVGLGLYFVSPIIQFFLHNFSEAVHRSELRFFGMEHNLMMIIAIALITIGSALSKRKATDRQKFKTMAIWFTIALMVIIVSIPWPFSTPLPIRPYFRPF
jgi:hypothetical protein